MEPTFRHPFTALVAGSTSSGKSTFVKNLLANHDVLISGISKPIINVLWSVGHENSEINYNSKINIKFVVGLPALQTIKQFKTHLLVIDDQVEMSDSAELRDIFVKHSHHNNFSCIFITQNIFFKSKFMRSISLNALYIILLKSLRDKMQVYALARQLFPRNSGYLIDTYTDATNREFGNFVVDVHPQNQSNEPRLWSLYFNNSIKALDKIIEYKQEDEQQS